MANLGLDEYQKLARENAIYKGQKAIDGLTYTVLALCGEAGELANVLKKSLRKGVEPDREKMLDELGDVLWYAAAVASELEKTLEQVAQGNLTKLAARRAARKVIG